MNLTEEEVEGVSGATMTSMAMAEGIVKTAASWEQRKNKSPECGTPSSINWKEGLWFFGGPFVRRFRRFSKRGKRNSSAFAFRFCWSATLA